MTSEGGSIFGTHRHCHHPTIAIATANAIDRYRNLTAGVGWFTVYVATVAGMGFLADAAEVVILSFLYDCLVDYWDLRYLWWGWRGWSARTHDCS